MKNVVFFLMAGFICAICFAETFYVTFPEKRAGADLQKSTIALRLDKNDLPIKEFFSVDVSSRSAELLSHPAGRRQFILVFDLIFSKPEQIVAARKTAVALLDQMGRDDLAAVAAMSRAAGLTFWSGFTADRTKLNAALNAVGLEKAPGTVFGPDGNLYSESFQSPISAELLTEDQFLKNVTTAIHPPDKKKSGPDPGSAYVMALNDLAFMLTSISGRKNIVLFSPGFDTKSQKIDVTEENFSDNYVNAAIREDTYQDTASEARLKEEEKRRKQREQAFRQSPAIEVEGSSDFIAGNGCTVFTVNSGAPAYDFFTDLTSKTGGLYLREAVDPAATATQILSSDQKYYVVGFEARREKQFKDLHKFHLTAGATVVAPEGWVAPRNYEANTPVEKRLHVSQSIYKNTGNPLPDQRFWADFDYQQGPRIVLFSQIPGESILKQDVNDYSLESYGFLLDASGKIVDFSSTPVRLDLKNKSLRERLGKAGVKVWSQLMGAPGAATVRWVTVDSQFGDTVTWSQPLEIKESGLTTTHPFLPSTHFDWLIWPKPQDAQTRRGAQFQYPYKMGQDLFFPELDPGISKAEKDQVVYFKVYNRLPETKNPPIHMYLVDAAGKQTEIQKFALMQKPREVEQNGIELFWKLLEVPDVPSGNYRLLVSIRDVLEKKDVVREMPVVVK